MVTQCWDSRLQSLMLGMCCDILQSMNRHLRPHICRVTFEARSSFAAVRRESSDRINLDKAPVLRLHCSQQFSGISMRQLQWKTIANINAGIYLQLQNMEVMHYPKIFAASETEPSTANSRSNKACIPCPVKNEAHGEVFKYAIPRTTKHMHQTY